MNKMDDLISRDYIKSLGGECIAARDSKTHELLPISSIDALPSAQPSNGACWGCQCEKVEKLQPEREKGKWIVCGDKHVCSECDEFALCDAYDVLETGEYQEKLSDFCPNCGADMREGQDERHD